MMMKTKRIGSRAFWIEVGLGTASAACVMLTIRWPQWIELLFGVYPDGGQGLTEWLITLSLGAVSLTLFTLATLEWRHIRAGYNP
jgi:hypothetical protein